MWWIQKTLDGGDRRLPPAIGQSGNRRAGAVSFLQPRPPSRAGVTLIELLCVIVIIAILMSMLMPALFRAYHRAKDMTDEWQAPEIAYLLQNESLNYCTGHPQFQFASKSDFADKCRLAPKCRDWVHASATEFVPFGYLDPTNKTVLSVHLGRKNATLYTFTKGDLSIRPQR